MRDQVPLQQPFQIFVTMSLQGSLLATKLLELPNSLPLFIPLEVGIRVRYFQTLIVSSSNIVPFSPVLDHVALPSHAVSGPILPLSWSEMNRQEALIRHVASQQRQMI